MWYAGTSPQGLFRSDHGVTWESVDGFNGHEKWHDWCGPKEQAPPDGARLHSINVDPRDARHLYIGMPGWRSRVDGSRASWMSAQQRLRGGLHSDARSRVRP